MMASNTYVDDETKKHFPVEILGWGKVDPDGRMISGDKNSYSAEGAGKVFSNLQYDIWEDSRSNRTVIAFKGSEEKIDWLASNFAVGISIAYKSAKEHVREYKEKHPDRKVTVTGHSLGGGLALSSSFRLGVDAVVFNTSPRIFDGLFNANEPAERLAIFQQGEFLQKFRDGYPKFTKKICPDQIVSTEFSYPEGQSKHRSDLIAEGLLSCATAPELMEVAQKINLSVSCYLPK